MQHSRASVGQKPLDEFVEVVATIYSAHDKHRSIWDVWSHTLHHAASVAEQTRRGARGTDLCTEVADFSLWLFTAILKLRGEFGHSQDSSEAPHDRFVRIKSNCSDLLWDSYPRACPICSASRIAQGFSPNEGSGAVIRCECGLPETKTEEPSARRNRITALQIYSQRNRGAKPVSINEWQDMFGATFGANILALSLSELASRLMEGLGQASDAIIRMYTYSPRDFVDGEPNWRQSSLEARLADVFFWLFALVEKLDSLNYSHRNESGARIRLSEIIWDRYGSDELGSFHCSKCKTAVCRCQIILVPGTHSTEALTQKFR